MWSPIGPYFSGGETVARIIHKEGPDKNGTIRILMTKKQIERLAKRKKISFMRGGKKYTVQMSRHYEEVSKIDAQIKALKEKKKAIKAEERA